ncbi:uncharacterized protein LOC119629001 isoform X4 [Bombyx mori]|uniref:uncharacterized protein LOC119629001 isoform X4 n=1 Tax=Bombyx mori TaxID=7091 RepID=UPI002ED5A988
MVESQEVLSYLIGKRRYVKGSLTRLYNQLGETERLSTETIQCRLERCVVAFREYGDYCGRILATNPADEEDSDERTAREYQLDRDNTMDPTVDQLLAFLEKRALAIENAGQSAAKLFTTKVVNAVTAKEKRECYFCTATGDDQLYVRDAPPASSRPGQPE